MQQVSLLGIRHHGPGSAYSVVQALTAIQPDIILIEGPPEAERVLALAGDPQMEPPVALLLYAEDDLAEAAFYPFALFSPEWQALRYGIAHALPVRFMDLPQTHHFALLRQAKAPLAGAVNPPAEQTELPPYLQERSWAADPLTLLAQAGGFDDGERWWERLVEQRQEGLSVFAGIAEAMTTLRTALEAEQPLPYREALREAWMRKTLRQAQTEGFQRIAVICGAWHVPALQEPADATADAVLVQNLPRCPVVATWTPWSYGRLASTSGYRAGVTAPGWYHFLWESQARQTARATFVTAGWLTQVARLLRGEGHDVAPASVIEAVRLGETLTALRDKPLPDLEELNEAALTTLCFGDPMLLQLIQRRLVIGERLGAVPETTPLTPLQADLARLQRALRLKPEAEERVLELDLRKENGLDRSKLLRRLLLLEIPWGNLASSGGGKGTFKEVWRLQWQPEFAVRLIEASIWGTTVAEAAVGFVRHHLQSQSNLAQITAVIDSALLADLPPAVDFAVQRLQTEAALANDVTALMEALPPLARVLRYGNVRATDTNVLTQILNGFVTRIVIGLPGACHSLDDAAAQTMLTRLEACHDALNLIQAETYLSSWWQTIDKLAMQEGLHGLLAGKCCRLLLTAEKIDSAEAATRFSYALSLANRPEAAAAWLAGMLRGSGLLLLHDERIWQVVDRWLTGLSEETFIQLLPLVRRTFADFAMGERRMMGEKVKQGAQRTRTSPDQQERAFDHSAGLAALPIVMQLLGLEQP